MQEDNKMLNENDMDRINGIAEGYAKRKTEINIEEDSIAWRAMNETFHRCFKTPDGKKILDYLTAKYLSVPIAMSGDSKLDIGERQGRANLINEIYYKIQMGKLSLQDPPLRI
jgi:hypothetical protein